MTITKTGALLRQASKLQREGRIAEAINAYERLLALKPDLPDSWYNLARLQRHARRFDASLASYRNALEHRISQPEEVHLNRAVILSDHLARPAEAQHELETALKLNPAYVPALLNFGNLHEDQGRRAKAREMYRRALAVEPGNPLALARLVDVTDMKGPGDPLLDRLRQALASAEVTAADKADLGFALGRALDSLGEYDEAFLTFDAANQASRAAFGGYHAPYDRRDQERFIDRLMAAFPARTDANLPPTAEAPIFICGMFRSGSTLIERILAGHSGVTAGGELDLLPALVRSELQPYPEAAAQIPPAKLTRLREAYLTGVRKINPESTLVTDKRPDNFLHIGLIKTLFPEAKIINTRRNPLDNCLSVYFLHLDPGMSYAFDLLDIAHWYRQHERLLTHWKTLYPEDIFEVDYDALVANPKPVLEGLVGFCGLPWEDSCLDFHTARGIVKTASVWQVREPLYQRASGRWRHYERHLGTLRSALEGPESS